MKILLDRLASIRALRRGFTLVELLIVVTIISIIGVASISGFSRMNTTQDMETLSKSIGDTLESLDQNITSHRSTSYDAIFNTGVTGFTTSVDWYQKHIPIRYAFDFSTGTGSLQTLGSGTGIIQIFLHSHDALGDTMQVTESSTTQTFSFPQNIEKRWFQILTFMDGADTIAYNIQYFNLLNKARIQEDEASLVRIRGSDGTLYPRLIVRNILGQKTLLGSGATLQPLSKAILTFEKNSQEVEMTIEP